MNDKIVNVHGQPNNVRTFVEDFFEKFRLSNNVNPKILQTTAVDMQCCIFGDDDFYCENGSHTIIYNGKSEAKMREFLNQWKELVKYRNRMYGKNELSEMKNVEATSKAKEIELSNASEELFDNQYNKKKLVESILTKMQITIKRKTETFDFIKMHKMLKVDLKVWKLAKEYLEVCF